MAINITDKHNCTGCSACYSVCPKSAIDFTPDNEGFYYPTVEHTKCIECGICERVCPVISPNELPIEQSLYAAVNTDSDIRESSTSGGVFTAFAESVIAKGGVVFGVAYDDNWFAQHTYTETLEGIAKFRGSKYMQSRLGNTFAKVKEFLDTNRWVLFSGTPCQADGLRRALRKRYERLIILDCVCYGVPSPKVFQHYLNELTEGEKPETFSFRAKLHGWRDYSISYDINGVNHNHLARKDNFTFAFMKHLSVRPSCFNCPDKGGRSEADITIADLWGVEAIMPEIDDNRGCSLVITNSTKGENLLQSCSSSIKQYPLKGQSALKNNPSYRKSAHEPKGRKVFMTGVIEGRPMASLIEEYKQTMPLHEKIRRFWKKIMFRYFK